MTISDINSISGKFSSALSSLQNFSTGNSTADDAWHQALDEAIQAANTSDMAVHKPHGHHHCKPHLNETELQQIIADAIQQGKLSQEEGDQLQALMATRKTEKAGGNLEAFMALLQPYMPKPDLTQLQNNAAQTIESLKHTMAQMGHRRFDGIKAAFETAKTQNALTPAQVDQINAWIANTEKFHALMAKIEPLFTKLNAGKAATVGPVDSTATDTGTMAATSNMSTTQSWTDQLKALTSTVTLEQNLMDALNNTLSDSTDDTGLSGLFAVPSLGNQTADTTNSASGASTNIQSLI